MKAISLWQPWASLWLSPAKVHETRHWPTSHRGWLLVHASKRKPNAPCGDGLDDIVAKYFGSASSLPRGALIGVVRLVACHRTNTMVIDWDSEDSECGDFADGRYGWQRSDYHTFAEPVPYRGSQGFFDVQDCMVADQFPREIEPMRSSLFAPTPEGR